MEVLPVDMLAKIAQNLSLKDLASSIAVSRRWRELFGSDEVWRRRCDPDLEECLRTSPCRVEPTFTSPEDDSTTLSPIGRWRIAYMREVHLWRNWIHMNYKTDIILNQYHQTHRELFLNNDVVILMHSNSIELRDTSVNAPDCMAELKGPCFSNIDKVTVIRTDTFITWSSKIIQVIEVDLKSQILAIKYTLSVSENENMIECITVDNICLGITCNSIHIWNLDNGSKLKSVSCPLVNSEFINFCFNTQNNCEDVVVDLHEKEEEWPRHCFIYSVKELRFLSFTKDFRPGYNYYGCAIVKNYIAVGFRDGFEVYNYNTSQYLYNVPVLSSFPLFQVLRDSFVFINDSRDLVNLSPSTGAINPLCSGIVHFTCYNTKLVSVSNTSGKVAVLKVGSEVSQFTPLVGIRHYSLHINQAHSKIIRKVLVHNHSRSTKTECVHFW